MGNDWRRDLVLLVDRWVTLQEERFAMERERWEQHLEVERGKIRLAEAVAGLQEQVKKAQKSEP